MNYIIFLYLFFLTLGNLSLLDHPSLTISHEYFSQTKSPQIQRLADQIGIMIDGDQTEAMITHLHHALRESSWGCASCYCQCSIPDFLFL